MSANPLRRDPQHDDEPARKDLDATVVRYRNAPDRCTVAPPDVSADRQLTAWLSLDADALVAATEMR